MSHREDAESKIDLVKNCNSAAPRLCGETRQITNPKPSSVILWRQPSAPYAHSGGRMPKQPKNARK
jgi:hypothetical protein